MALAKQIEQFRLIANGNTYDLNIQNMNFKWGGEYYNEPKKSVGGKILASRSFAGRRLNVEISYNQNIEPSTWRDMTNDIMTDYIYNNVSSLTFYPDASDTTASGLINQSTASFDAATDIITTGGALAHGFNSGQYVQVVSNDITGLSNGFYFVEVITTTSFALSSNIAGARVDLSGTTTNRSIDIDEIKYVKVIPEDITELEVYDNTIGSFQPSINFKSEIRYVTIPEVFQNI